MNWLNGKKTFVGIIAWGVAGLLESFGVIDAGMADKVQHLAEMLGGVGIAHKIDKATNAVKGE